LATRRRARPKRDIERDYPPRQLAAKLHRLADCIEQGKRFQIRVAGERVSIPSGATIRIEHERGASEEGPRLGASHIGGTPCTAARI
jgi:hypothetical protein